MLSTTQAFSYDFFSGAQVGLWVGSRLITTAVGIEFQLVQNKRPIYGYASQLWDGVAKGTVQCSGMLILNFQQSQLLPTLIAKAVGVDASDLKAMVADRHVNNLKGIENPLVPDPSPESRSGRGQPDLLTPNRKEALRKYYWSGDPSTVRRSTTTDPLILLDRPDEIQPFDVLVTYGDVFGNDIRLHQGFNDPRVLSAVRRLSQVRLTGFGQTITVDGQPVLEQYPFICREVR